MFRRFPIVVVRSLLATRRYRMKGIACRRHMVTLAGDTTHQRREGDRQHLLNLVHQGQFEQVLLAWEREKELNQADPTLYTVVMAMCERLKSAELALAIKADMEQQKWEMELECCVHFVKALLSEGRAEEALEFVRETYARSNEESGPLLLQCAQAFMENGHVTEALKSCDLHPADSGLEVDVALDCIRLECLGKLQNSRRLLSLVEEKYSDPAQRPAKVQAAKIHGFSLANELGLAMDSIQESFKQRSEVLQPKTLALLLECAVRTKDYVQAPPIHHQLWNRCTQLTEDSFRATSTDRASHLLRATNAAIHLQARTRLLLRDRGRRGAMSEGEQLAILEFLGKNFYKVILEEGLLPNSETVESLLFLSAFEDHARDSAEKALRVMVRNGETPQPRAFTKWATMCGRVNPVRVRRVIQHVRMLVHGYNIPLGYVECGDLLSIDYFTNEAEHRVEAARNVRIIKRIMDANKLLSNITSWNILLSGFLKTRLMKSVHLTFEDIAENNLKPNLDTFKALVDEINSLDKYHFYTLAIYDFWREFTRLYPAVQPDLDYLNMLLVSCRKCRHVDRAMFFLGVMEQCGLTPNLASFRELLMMCSECEERKKFDALLTMARKCLPHESACLDAVVADSKLKWKAKVDGALASSIIYGTARKPTPEPGTLEVAARETTEQDYLVE